MPQINDLNGPNRAMFGNMAFSKGVLQIATASSPSPKTTAAVSYTNNGIFYSLAAATFPFVVATGATPLALQPVGTIIYYAVVVDASQNVRMVQGWYDGQNLAPPGAQTVVNAGVPEIPVGYTLFGVLKVTSNGATTFTPGTTALDAAGITTAYYDVNIAPSRPYTSGTTTMNGVTYPTTGVGYF